MKHQETKSSLTELAKLLFDKIKTPRDDFFNGTAIVFPDLRMEKWFKSYWLKTEESVLMNINCYNIRDALFMMLEKDKDYKLVNKEQLKYYILKRLVKEELTSNTIIEKYKKYIKKDGKINPINLYDLSNEMTTAFMEYEAGNASLNDEYLLDFYNRLLDDLKANHKLVTLKNACDGEYKIVEDGLEINFFGFVNFTDTETKIIEEYHKKHDVTIYQLDIKQDELCRYKKNLNDKTSLNRLREIEHIHTSICKLVQKDGCSFSDFLVVAPSLTEYETLINRVFHQDGVNFPNIPFSINNSELKESDATTLINVLVDISHKGFYTRKDFAEIISNAMVMKSRGLNEDEVDMFLDSLINTNVYRQRENHDDWDYIKKRLLLSKLSGINDTNNIVELSDDNYIPYQSIGFDDDAIVHFVKVIDDLNSWVNLINNNSSISKDFLDGIKSELDKWLSFPNEDGLETNFTYKAMINVINSYKEYEITGNNIPIDILFYSLIDASKRKRSSCGDILSGGVTFVNFEHSSILSAPYVYFLGASSNNLPSRQPKSELYTLDKTVPVSELERKLFYLQFVNAEKEFHISFVMKDLKTEEEFYPSIYINELKRAFNIQIKENKDLDSIPLDETRKQEDLYTSREFKNKDYYQGLFDIEDDFQEEAESEAGNQVIMDTITLSDIEKYLKEPLMFQANRILRDEDDNNEDIENEYEPFKLNSLQKYKIRKNLIERSIKGEDLDDPGIIDRSIEGLSFNNELPGLSAAIDKGEIEEIIVEAKGVKEALDALPGKKTYEILKDLKLNDIYLIVDNEPVCRTIEGNNRHFLRITKQTKGDESLLYAYAYSLMDVASLEDNEEWIINLANCNNTFKLTRDEARVYLLKICNGINSIIDTKCIPFKLLKDVETCSDLFFQVTSEHGPWGNFDHKKSFDETQLGYEDGDGFDYEHQDSVFKELIKFLSKKEEEASDGCEDESNN